MYRGGRRGRGRGRGGHQHYGRGGHQHYARQGDRRPRIPRRKQYFETNAASRSAVLLKPISKELEWKFTQMRAGPTEFDYTRYELSLGEERLVQRSVSRHSDNLQDIKGILRQKLREAFEKKPSCKLDCQARLGKLIWLGELIECGRSDIPGMQLCQFEGPPRYNEDRKPHLKNEYYTRANVKSSLLTELERRHGAQESPHLSLQIRMRDSRPDGGEYVAIATKEPATGKFYLERLSKPDEKLAEFAGDLVCFGRYHDVRISTKCFQLEEPQPTPNISKIIDSMKLSDQGELEMILKHGLLKVELIRQREKHIFQVKEENGWQIKYSTIKEHLLSRDHFYADDAVAPLEVGHDNRELEVLLNRKIDRDDSIEEIIEEIMRLIEFSLDISEVCEKHLDI